MKKLLVFTIILSILSYQLLSCDGTKFEQQNENSSTSSGQSQTHTPYYQNPNYEYVLNTKTKTIHTRSCRYVEKIERQNYATATYSQIPQDFEKCKVCKPIIYTPQ